MNRFEEWVNDFTIMGDDGEVIFSSYDRFVEFIEEIVVAERKREREACAVLCENMERNGAWITKAEAAAALRQALAHDALDRMVAENQRLGLYDDAVSEERVHKTDKRRTLAELLDSTPECSDHPDAPHGFNRDMSHSLGRYVCDCEGWVPEDKWVGLTDEEIMDRWPCETRIEFARWVEAKLKEKNT